MAGDELPSGQGGPKSSVELRVVTWLVRAYFVWVVGNYLFISTSLELGIMIGVSLIALAVLATRPRDQRG